MDYLNYLDTHLKDEAATYVDRTPELHRLLNQVAATLEDVERAEGLLLARFQNQIGPAKEVDAETQLATII